MRYLVLSILTALVVAAAVPVFAHRETRSGETACVEIVSDSGSAYLSIPHKHSWKGKTRVIKNYLGAIKDENYGS